MSQRFRGGRTRSSALSWIVDVVPVATNAYAHVGTGGLVLGSTSSVALGRLHTGAGGIVVGSNSSSVFSGNNFVHVGTGGFVLGSATTLVVERVHLGAGGLVLDSDSVVEFHRFEHVGSGGLVLGSSSAAKLGRVHTGAGGLVLDSGSSSSFIRTFLHTGSGGLVLGSSSTAAFIRVFVHTGVGGLVFGSNSSVIANITLIERYANLAETTVAAGGYASGSGFLNVASTALPFPQLGSFRIEIADPLTEAVKVVLRVKSVASSTKFYVEAEGTDASAILGDKVCAVLSAGGLDAVRSDMRKTGLMSALPTIGTDGDAYWADDGFAHRRTSGVWTPYMFSRKMKRPRVADYVVINAASSSFTDVADGVVLRNVANESGLNVVKLAAPTAPYSLVARLTGMAEFTTGHHPGFGVCFRESGSGKLITLMIGCSDASDDRGTFVSVELWDDAVTFNGELVSPRDLRIVGEVVMKLTDDGVTDKTLAISAGEEDYETILSEGRSAHSMTPDEIGLFVKTDGAAQLVRVAGRSWLTS